MSHAAVLIIRGMDVGPPARKLVLLMLATHQNSTTGQLNPSVTTLARECGITTRQVQRHLHDLKQLGLVSVQANASGGKFSPQYALLLPGCSVKPEADTATEPENQIQKEPTPDVAEERSPSLQDQGTPVQNSPSRSTPDKAKPKASDAAAEGLFDQFWAAYPRRVDKANARKAFTKLRPSESTLQQMLTSIRQSAGSSDWQKDGGKYIPYPSTWLNGRRWEDEGPSEAARASVASEWWLDAGFSSQFEAENMGCHLYNRTAFKDGSPIQEITA